MSKWEKSIQKNATTQDNCLCSEQYGLFLSSRQLSALIASLLLLFFIIFITGYFLGKRYAVVQFVEKLRQELPADKTQNDNFTIEEDNDKLAALSDNIIENSVKQNENNVLPEIETFEIAESVQQQTDQDVAKTQSMLQYYAQLIGFGTEKAAQQFAQKLASKNIETQVKKHMSKSAKGRISYWYQVITVPYDDKNELSQVVAQLVKEEKLQGVVIKTC